MLSSGLSSGCVYNYNNTPLTLVNKDRSQIEITDPFVRVLGLAGIRIKDDYIQPDANWPQAKLTVSSRRLEAINQAIQGKQDSHITWLIKGERWQTNGINYLHLTSEQSNNIIDLILKDLQFGEAMLPTKNNYTGILFLGSTLHNARQRLNFLNTCLDKHNIVFNKLYLLTGVGPLSPTIGETAESLLDPKNTISVRPDWKAPDILPTEEGAMIQWVFNQSRSQKIKPEQIEMIYAGIGEGRTRATTRTTVEEWLKTNPSSGVYLVVSSQPFNLYQKLVVQNTLLANHRPDIKIEVIGGAFVKKHDDNQKTINQYAAIGLDTIARICYELVNFYKLSFLAD